MFQKTIESNRMKNAEPLRLFAKLKQQKMQEKQTEQIFGVPMIESDASDHEDDENRYIEEVKRRLEAFKLEKARTVVKLHHSTKRPVEDLVNMLKEQLSYQALCIIDEKYKRSAEKTKQTKEAGSTLPGSEERQAEIQTPGFDLQTTNGKPVGIDIDLREFTLGQKDELNCLNEDVQFVTEFQANGHKSTKTIKNKIMMRRE